jgi:hypothetical protein
MTWEMSGWKVGFSGCTEKDRDCHAGKFEVSRAGEPAHSVEVLTTMQTEHILAGEMDKPALSDDEREVILAVAGRHLIEECIERGHVPAVLYLSGQLLMTDGAARRLLRECGLISEDPLAC